MLRHAPARMRAWASQQLGVGVPGSARYRDVAKAVHAAFDARAAVAPSDMQTIVHHYDVYHVEVKLVDAFKAHVTAATRTTLKLPDRLPGAKFPHPKYTQRAKPKAQAVVEPAAAAVGGLEDDDEEAPHLSDDDEDDDEAEAEAQAAVGEEAAAAAAASLAQAVNTQQKREAADLVKLEELRADARAANAQKLASRSELLGADAGLLDTLRHHFYRVASYGASLTCDVSERRQKVRNC